MAKVLSGMTVTVVGPFAEFYIGQSANIPGSCAMAADRNKRDKYRTAESRYLFFPFACVSVGQWGESANKRTEQLGSKVCAITERKHPLPF